MACFGCARLFESVPWVVNACSHACRFAFCEVEESFQTCPPGMNVNDDCPIGDPNCYSCPAHRDCYVPCSEQDWGSWIPAPGSPYNGHAFCERFPRADASLSSPLGWEFEGEGDEGSLPQAYEWTFLAQAGKSSVSRHNFDNIFTSVVTIFQILTGAHSRALQSRAALFLALCRYRLRF